MKRRYQLRLALRQLGRNYDRKYWGRAISASPAQRASRPRRTSASPRVVVSYSKGYVDVWRRERHNQAVRRVHGGYGVQWRQDAALLLLAFLLLAVVVMLPTVKAVTAPDLVSTSGGKARRM